MVTFPLARMFWVQGKNIRITKMPKIPNNQYESKRAVLGLVTLRNAPKSSCFISTGVLCCEMSSISISVEMDVVVPRISNLPDCRLQKPYRL